MYPGGAVIPIYDEIIASLKLNIILFVMNKVQPMQQMVTSRVSGSVGVCLAGRLVLVNQSCTGIMTAYMDSVPMVAITGQVGRPFIGRDSSQEADIRVLPCRLQKHNYLVQDIRDFTSIIKEAYFIAVQVVQDLFLSIFLRMFKQKNIHDRIQQII